MENLAHTLCGLRIAELGLFRRIGPRAGWIGVIAANLPDADLLLALAGRETYLLWHRGITHSIFGAPVLVALGAVATRRWAGGTLRDHLALWTLALGSHLLLDWPTTWGTMLLLPLTDHRFALDWIFIVDPMFWLTLGLLPWLLRRTRERAAGLGLAALVGWILGAGAIHTLAEHRTGLTLYPAPLAPLSWTGVQRQGNTVQRAFVAPGAIDHAGSFAAPEGAAVEAFRRTSRGERYFWMARAPVLRGEERREGKVLLTLSDLAYTSALAPDQFRFTTTFEVEAP